MVLYPDFSNRLLDHTMSINPSLVLPSPPFWHFSLQIHNHENAKDALIHLQNRHELNVNVLLFCSWYAASGQGYLPKPEIKRLLTAIHLWHERIILPLRTLRDCMKSTSAHPRIQGMCEEALSAELAAEHIEQLLIYDRMAAKLSRQRRTPYQRATAACQNIANYCDILYTILDQADCEKISKLLSVIFPELHADIISTLCTQLLLQRQNAQQNKKQLKLPLYSR